MIEFVTGGRLNVVENPPPPSVIVFIVFQGASVDLPDKSRRTPLFMAASSGATETVELLISRGANITAKNLAMKSVLHSAVGHDNTIDALLKVSVA